MPTGATKKGVAAGQDGQAKDMFFTRVFEFILKRTSDTHYQKLRHECLIAIGDLFLSPLAQPSPFLDTSF